MIRKAKYKDVNSIFSLIDFYSAKGQMLYRPLEEIADGIYDFLVYEIDKQVIGTCSLKYGWDHLVEARSLAIHPDFCRRGFATHIVQKCIEHAKQRYDAEGIFVLTYALPLFLKLGFEIIPKSSLPLKVWEDCMGCPKRENCDETAMFLALQPVESSLLNLGEPAVV